MFSRRKKSRKRDSKKHSLKTDGILKPQNVAIFGKAFAGKKAILKVLENSFHFLEIKASEYSRGAPFHFFTLDLFPLTIPVELSFENISLAFFRKYYLNLASLNVVCFLVDAQDSPNFPWNQRMIVTLYKKLQYLQKNLSAFILWHKSDPELKLTDEKIENLQNSILESLSFPNISFFHTSIHKKSTLLFLFGRVLQKRFNALEVCNMLLDKFITTHKLTYLILIQDNQRLLSARTNPEISARKIGDPFSEIYTSISKNLYEMHPDKGIPIGESLTFKIELKDFFNCSLVCAFIPVLKNRFRVSIQQSFKDYLAYYKEKTFPLRLDLLILKSGLCHINFSQKEEKNN